MESKKIDREKNPVAYLRERFFERLRNWKPSPELIEATREKKPVREKEDATQPKSKIAQQKPREDLDR